jgi:hypothetical protein
MQFLTNDICDFEILNNTDLIKDNINIIVSVFFKRDQYYKNFDIYVKGLQRVIQYIDNLKEDFIYVIFIDQNIADDQNIMKLINNCKKCVPVLFKCVKYMYRSNDNNYHYDLFGTLVRFFPMFDFPNNPSNIVICIDVDLHTEDYFRLDTFIKYKLKGFAGAGNAVRILYQNKKPYIYANLMYFNQKKIDKSLIINFIQDADNGKITSKGYYGKRLTNFGFGVDEIFINDILIEHIKKFNIIIEYQLSYFLYHSKKYILEKSKINGTSILIDTILGPYLKPKMNINDKFKFIDDNTFLIRNLTPINNELTIRFTKVIDQLIESKRLWMESNIQHFIHKYLRHIISSNLIIQVEYNKITNVITHNAVYDNDNDS